MGRGINVCSRGLGHMTKMAAKPISGKIPLIAVFYGTDGSIAI